MIPFGAASGRGAIKLSATWGDLTADGVANANVTLVFQGGARTIRVNHFSGGILTDLEYRINSGTYTNATDETTFAVSNGDTLNFRHNGGSVTETVEVYDQTRPAVVLDAFAVNIA